jgi:MFS family permease
MISAGLSSKYAVQAGVRTLTIIGLVVTIGGMLLLARTPVDGTYLTDMFPPIMLTSLGMGAVFVALTMIATMGLEDSDQGLASGLFNTSQQIGGALGLAILATLAAGRADAAGGETAEALVHGFRWAFAGSALFLTIGLVAFVTLLRRRHVVRIEAEAATATSF